MRNLLIACMLSCMVGCAGLPRHVHKITSQALPDPENTALGHIVETSGGVRNLSGVRLLASGDEALASLLSLADHADRTLDLQYYLIHKDESSNILLQHIRMAADRGVRVRLLVDDLNTAGEDRRFMHLEQHAHVEVRVFNPFPGGRFSLLARILASLGDVPRINHRMHNKLFVADNALAITGGRNIGDQYFTRDSYSNFIDLDVVAAGSVVPQLSSTFDAFWNSKYAYPIASIASPVPPETGSPTYVDDQFAADAAWLEHDIGTKHLELAWVPATVLADGPAKIASESSPNEEDTIANNVKELMRSAKQEVIVISPYFVPGDDGVALMRELIARGVHIRVLTNSLASTDSPLVHNGYARYRETLLKLGVELSEVRPKLGQKRKRFHPFKSSTASLHAKALVIDQKTVFIGSMNMDARSARTNSEMGIVMRSTDLARQVINLLDDISADAAYRLKVDPSGQMVWSSGDVGAEHIWYTDPETTMWQRVTLKLVAPFAPEEML